MSLIKLIRRVSEDSKTNIKDIAPIVKSVFSCIQKSLEEKESVTIKEFGRFNVVTRKARQGRNPKTGEKILIPESDKPNFKYSEHLVNAIKSGEKKEK